MADSEKILNNIIKYYSNVSDRALTTLAKEKKFQFKRNLTNFSLQQVTKQHFESIIKNEESKKMIDEYLLSMNNMYKVAQKEYNIVLNKLKSTNDTVLKQKILYDYADKGISGFIAKNGYKWNIETYSNMYTNHLNNELIRLKIIEESKNKLWKVSSHNCECELCLPFEGEILDDEGLESAKKSGLFHPNCIHTLTEVK